MKYAVHSCPHARSIIRSIIRLHWENFQSRTHFHRGSGAHMFWLMVVTLCATQQHDVSDIRGQQAIAPAWAGLIRGRLNAHVGPSIDARELHPMPHRHLGWFEIHSIKFKNGSYTFSSSAGLPRGPSRLNWSLPPLKTKHYLDVDWLHTCCSLH